MNSVWPSPTLLTAAAASPTRPRCSRLICILAALLLVPPLPSAATWRPISVRPRPGSSGDVTSRAAAWFGTHRGAILFDDALPPPPTETPASSPSWRASLRKWLGSFIGPPGGGGDDHPRVVRMTWTIEGEGFHRVARVGAAVTWRASTGRSGRGPMAWPSEEALTCRLAVVLRLPANVYADRYELEAETVRSNERAEADGRARAFDAVVFEDAFVIGEKAAHECNASVVALIAPGVVTRGPDGDGRTWLHAAVNASAPVHARYPAAVDAVDPWTMSAYVNVSVPPPRVLLKCDGPGDESAPGVTAGGAWKVVAPPPPGSVPAVMWSIPAGVRGHLRVVEVGTMLAQFAAAAMVIFASYRSRL